MNVSFGVSKCSGCDPGTYHHIELGLCMKCPHGMYQDLSFATSCLPCNPYFVSVESRRYCVDTYEINGFLSATIYIFGSFAIFVYSLSIIFVIKHRLSKPIHNASTIFLVMILFGYIFLSVSAILFGTTPSFVTYQVRIWLLCFGFNLVFLSLLSKLYRLNSYFVLWNFSLLFLEYLIQ